jgi:hypothetical protein
LYPETVLLNDLGNPSRDPVASGGALYFPGLKKTARPMTFGGQIQKERLDIASPQQDLCMMPATSN